MRGRRLDRLTKGPTFADPYSIAHFLGKCKSFLKKSLLKSKIFFADTPNRTKSRVFPPYFACPISFLRPFEPRRARKKVGIPLPFCIFPPPSTQDRPQEFFLPLPSIRIHENEASPHIGWKAACIMIALRSRHGLPLISSRFVLKTGTMSAEADRLRSGF